MVTAYLPRPRLFLIVLSGLASQLRRQLPSQTFGFVRLTAMIELAEKQEQAVDDLPWPVRACQREAPAATGQSLVGPDLAG